MTLFTTDYLEYYLTLVSWIVHNGIWAVLVSSGVFALPFVAIIVQEWLKARSEGADEGNKGVLSAARIENRVFVAIVVVMFAGIPFIDVDLNTIKYDSSRSAQCQVSVPLPADTGWSQSFSTINNQSAKVPVWWAFSLTQVLGRGALGLGDQILKRLPLGFVLFLNQRREPDAGHRLGLGAGIARALLLLPEHPRSPLDCLLRRGPSLARQACATGGRNRGCVGHAAAIDQVVACAGDIADHFDGGLARAAGIAAAHPGHAVVAPARLGLLDGRDGIGTRNGIAQCHAFCHLAPPELAARRVGHLLGHSAAGQLRAVEVQTGLQYPVREQIVETGIGPLDDQRRQGRHRAGRTLDHR